MHLMKNYTIQVTQLAKLVRKVVMANVLANN